MPMTDYVMPFKPVLQKDGTWFVEDKDTQVLCDCHNEETAKLVSDIANQAFSRDLPTKVPGGYCTLCSRQIPSFDGLTKCPRCGTTSKPCSNRDQVAVSINLHELRILCIWAENWADKCRDDASSPSDMSELIKAITARIRPQLPESSRVITMRDEFAELENHGKLFSTNHPANEGNNLIGRFTHSSDDPLE